MSVGSRVLAFLQGSSMVPTPALGRSAVYPPGRRPGLDRHREDVAMCLGGFAGRGLGRSRRALAFTVVLCLPAGRCVAADRRRLDSRDGRREACPRPRGQVHGLLANQPPFRSAG
jgi:hypothetical protein